MFLRNLLFGEEHVLNNRALHIDGVKEGGWDGLGVFVDGLKWVGLIE